MAVSGRKTAKRGKGLMKEGNGGRDLVFYMYIVILGVVVAVWYHAPVRLLGVGTRGMAKLVHIFRERVGWWVGG